MITLEQIRIKLIEEIKRSGKTQTEIAKSIGVSQQTISHYIKGDKMPALDTFANICLFLDIDANEILCLQDAKSNKI